MSSLTLISQSTDTQPCSKLRIDAVSTPACQGGSGGKLELNIAQGLPPYLIQWEDGTYGKLRKNLAAGEYRVSVTDVLGCSTDAVLQVIENPAMHAQVQLRHNQKSSHKKGAITIHMSGGKAPYRYSWVSNAIDLPQGFHPGLNKIEKLPAGRYRIIIFDALSCYYEIDTEVR